VNRPRHPETDRILEKLREEGVPALYHFTSVENLRVVRELNALCSKELLERAGRWPVAEPGGDQLSHDLDRYNNNWDKISLNFTPHTPMAYHKKQQKHLCFFVIDIAVAAWRGVVFTDTNAASTCHQERGEGLEGLNLVNFQAIRSQPRPWDREGWVRPVQAETLVPNRIPLENVHEIGFVSKASRDEARRIWGGGPHPNFTVRPRYFSDNPRGVSINFPYLVNIYLTDELVDASSVNAGYTLKNRFCRDDTDTITVVAEVNATAGVRARVIWDPCGREDVTEFERSCGYWHWLPVPISDLADGRCSVQYWLDQVRWATLAFEVVS